MRSTIRSWIMLTSSLTMPAEGEPLTEAQIQIIYDWIADGTQNNWLAKVLVWMNKFVNPPPLPPSGER